MAENNFDNECPGWFLFIGKWGDSDIGHPLVYHMIDSAATATMLWERGLTEGSRLQFSAWLGLSHDDCRKILAFWTSLHDLGKATPAFQRKHLPTQVKLEERGFNFPSLSKADLRDHSLLSQWTLKDLKEELGIFPEGIFNQFRFSIGGHHGSFHIQEDDEQSLARINSIGNTTWAEERKRLFNALKDLLEPPALPSIRLSQTERNAFFNLLTGYFVAADWISSQDDPFSYTTSFMKLEDYGKLALQRAKQAMVNAGWFGWQPDEKGKKFQDLFGFEANPLQERIVEISKNLEKPFLMIIEAPTGSGKTEAALTVADLAIRTGKLRGYYVAMPTQATSNQMFNRNKKYLEKRFPDQKINLQLAHGNALMNEELKEIRLSSIEDEDANGTGNVNAMDWFLPKKRTFLAPFGVGTVDQTFLSILRTRHAFLRLFGLHQKVVIFDEVHAYDVYMMEIFNRLLAWLRAVGTSVILLSATLPEKTRLSLAKAYQRDSVIENEKVAYPRVCTNSGKVIRTTNLGTTENRTIHLERVSREPEEVVRWLKEMLKDGGCGAVICNTIDRAQELYARILVENPGEIDEIHLLHSRMPFCWRDEVEKKILDLYGKKHKPFETYRRGIVVATQIIEQSLDLDFDLLITDLAPADLLIQRIGRLHRHTFSTFPPIRPKKLVEPTCIICQPEFEQSRELPIFSKDVHVYDEVTLQRTLFTLSTCKDLTLPLESDWIINKVYSNEDLPECGKEQNEQIHQLYKKMIQKQEGESTTAFNRMAGDVDDTNALGDRTAYIQEDDLSLGMDAQALTRNNLLPNVQLVCIEKIGGELFLLNQLESCNPRLEFKGEQIRDALMASLSISHSAVVRNFVKKPAFEPWKKIPSLRRAYPAIFDEGRCKLEDGTILCLDRHIGLLIEKPDMRKEN